MTEGRPPARNDFPSDPNDSDPRADWADDDPLSPRRRRRRDATAAAVATLVEKTPLPHEDCTADGPNPPSDGG